MTKELTDDQLCGIARGTKTAEPGRDGYILPVSFARAVIAADRAMQDARHREELAAADLTISNLRAAQGVPDGFVHEFKINRAILYRAMKRQLVCRELQVFSFIPYPVHSIAHHRKSGTGHMTANLMFTTGFYFHFYQ